MTRYVDTHELESAWNLWLTNKDDANWEALSMMVFRICEGVAKRFNPRDEDEHIEHTHDAVTAILEKIKDGRLKFTPGKAPVFNLLTTTAFHMLYSKMNKQNKIKKQMDRYRERLATGFTPMKNHSKSSDLQLAEVRINQTDAHYKYSMAFCQYLSKTKNKQSSNKLTNEDLMKRYSHYIPNSVRDVKGRRVATAKCQISGKDFDCFTSDLWQLRHCPEVRERMRREKRRAKTSITQS